MYIFSFIESSISQHVTPTALLYSILKMPFKGRKINGQRKIDRKGKREREKTRDDTERKVVTKESISFVYLSQEIPGDPKEHVTKTSQSYWSYHKPG